MALLLRYVNGLAQLRLPVLLFIVALLFLPSIMIGLISDDLFHFILLGSDFDLKINSPISPWGLFSFVSFGDEHRQVLQSFSMLDWWTSDDFAWQFWRPLSELSHALDYYLWPDSFGLMHAHNIALFLVLLVVLKQLLLQLGITNKLAGLCLVIFALSSSHAFSVAWLANRNALLAMIFALMALGFHHRASSDKRFYLASLLSVSACLLAGEIGLSVGGLLFAYAVSIDKRAKASALVALLPYLLPLLLWALVYTHHQMGLKGSSWNYIDPLQFPLEYLQALVVRLPVIVFSQFAALPAELFMLSHYLSVSAALLGGLILCGLVMISLQEGSRQAELRFFLLAMLVSCLPICAYAPEDRNLLFVSIGGSGVVAYLILRLLEGNRLALVAAGSLVFLHLVLSPLLLPFAVYAPKFLLQGNIQQAKAVGDLGITASDDVYLFGGDERFYLLPRMLAEGITVPQSLQTLIPQGTQFEVLDVGEHSLTLELKKPFLQYLQAQDASKHPLKTFEREQLLPLQGAQLTVLEIDHASQPKVLQVKFARPVAALSFMAWREGRPYIVNLRPGLRLDTGFKP